MVGVIFLHHQFLQIRCSEIASEAIWNKSRAVVAVWLTVCKCSPSFHERTGNEARTGNISVKRLRAHSARCIAATKLVWTAVTFNGTEASGLLANGRSLKMYR